MISFHPVRWDATLSLRIYARFVPEGGMGHRETIADCGFEKTKRVKGV